MKRLVGLSVIIGLIVIAVLSSVGFSDDETATIAINSKAFKHLPKPLMEGKMAELSKEKLGFDTKVTGSDNVLLQMQLKAKKDNEFVELSGNGFLKFGVNNFSFMVNEDLSYFTELNNDGRRVLVGPIIGEIKSKDGSIEEITIQATYYPDTEQGQFGVVVGNIGQEIMIPYGDPIIDEKLMNLIENATNNKQS